MKLTRPKITPGEWISVRGNTMHIATSDEEANKQGFIATICEKLSDEIMEANGSAISALPLCLEALERCLPFDVASCLEIVNSDRHDGRIACEITVGDLRAIWKALLASGYTIEG